jgi:hypothetical protein
LQERGREAWLGRRIVGKRSCKSRKKEYMAAKHPKQLNYWQQSTRQLSEIRVREKPWRMTMPLELT